MGSQRCVDVRGEPAGGFSIAACLPGAGCFAVVDLSEEVIDESTTPCRDAGQ